MSRFLHYEPCPKCNSIGRDNRGDNLAMYSDGGGHCFSCGYHIYGKYSKRVLPKEKEINATVFPNDVSREVPSHALRWLLQYGLPYSYWHPFIGWSEKESRLIFATGNTGIGRLIETTPSETPARKWYTYGAVHEHAHVISPIENAIQQVVLVEDIISAHKVGQVAYAIPLFGTKVFDACIPLLRYLNIPIVMWLDKDQEQTMPKKCSWLSAITGLPVKYLVTKDDPKLQSINTIKGLL